MCIVAGGRGAMPECEGVRGGARGCEGVRGGARGSEGVRGWLMYVCMYVWLIPGFLEIRFKIRGRGDFGISPKFDQNKGPSAEICPLFTPSGLAFPRIFRNFIQNKRSKLRLLRARLRAAEEPLRRAANALAGRLRAGGRGGGQRLEEGRWRLIEVN